MLKATNLISRSPKNVVFMPIQYRGNNMGMTEIMLNPHVSSNYQGSVKGNIQSRTPFTSSNFFGVSKVFGGTKYQQVQNLIKQNEELLKYSYDRHNQSTLSLEEDEELVTKVSPVEFSNHPSIKDGAFNEDMTKEIFEGMIESFKKNVSKDDKNFMFTTTLPTESIIRLSKDREIVADQNVFLTLGMGVQLGPDNLPRQAIGSVVYAKVNPFPSDVRYQDNFASLNFNCPVFILKTNDGNYVLNVNEICLDHRLGQGKQAYESWLSNVAKNQPEFYPGIVNLPLIHDVQSSSVEINPTNLLSDTVIHTNREIQQNTNDFQEHMWGIKTYKKNQSGQLSMQTNIGEKDSVTLYGRKISININEVIPIPKQNEHSLELVEKIAKENFIVTRENTEKEAAEVKDIEVSSKPTLK